MKLHLSTLLLGLLLCVAAACGKKKDPAPAAPVLEGTWSLVRTSSGTPDSVTGRYVVYLSSIAPVGERPLRLTATEWQVLNPAGVITARFPYTRQQDRLLIDNNAPAAPAEWHIVGLTADSLHLRTRYPWGSPQYIQSDHYYTR